MSFQIKSETQCLILSLSLSLDAMTCSNNTTASLAEHNFEQNEKKMRQQSVFTCVKMERMLKVADSKRKHRMMSISHTSEQQSKRRKIAMNILE